MKSSSSYDISFLEELLVPGRLESLSIPNSSNIGESLFFHVVRGIVAADLSNKKNQIPESRDHMERTLVNKTSCDILVLCPMAIEQEMTCLAFNVDFFSPTRTVGGTKEYDCVVQSQLYKRDIRITISAMNRQTNVRAASRARTIIERNRPQVAILTGIGATMPDNKLGHVVTIDTVYYPESRVKTGGEDKPRTLHHDVDNKSQSELENYKRRCDRTSWKQEMLVKCLELRKAIDGDIPKVSEIRKIGFKCSLGKVMSGESLRKDGGIKQEAEEINEKIKSVEMEAFGFAETAKEAHLPWFVFRGHCDFGDQDKEDKWQLQAALNSALCVKDFIIFEHTLPDDAAF